MRIRRRLWWRLFPELSDRLITAEKIMWRAHSAAVESRRRTMDLREKFGWALEDALMELEYVVAHGTHRPAEDDGDPDIVLLIDRIKRALAGTAT